jgi:hypothetical protein
MTTVAFDNPPLIPLIRNLKATSEPWLTLLQSTMANLNAADMEMAETTNDTAAAAGAAVNTGSAEARDVDQPKPKLYPKGWKLHVLTAG